MRPTGRLELMQAVDDYIPTPTRAVDKPFLMPIEDVFGIKGRGTVVTGRVERGVVKPGEEIEIVGMGSGARSWSPAWRCFRRRWMRGWPATTWAACCAGWSATRCSGAGAEQARLDQPPHPLPGRGLRAGQGGGGATPRSSPATGRSSTSAPRT